MLLEVCKFFSDLRLLVVDRVSTCQCNKPKMPFVLFSQTVGTKLYWCRRQSDLSHLTSTEEDSVGSSWQFALSASVKCHGLLAASNAFHG